ncbi:hypothetical protein [Haloplanus salilacus]|uniref:hypothetical protein n=1 Tax=Haloplanus salilacus TaxID=2949994 RepID=UPI0030D05A45
MLEPVFVAIVSGAAGGVAGGITRLAFDEVDDKDDPQAIANDHVSQRDVAIEDSQVSQIVEQVVESDSADSELVEILDGFCIEYYEKDQKKVKRFEDSD